MKLNLSRLVLTAGLSIGIISFASVAEAGIELNGSSLSEQNPIYPVFKVHCTFAWFSLFSTKLLYNGYNHWYLKIMCQKCKQ